MAEGGPGARRGGPKMTRVKNKQPANVQITAEQLLREAQERRLEAAPPPPKQQISDPEELADFRLQRRKQFEDDLRKNRGWIGNYIKYAQWEEQQGEIDRARSVYERALGEDHRNVALWIKYAELEMKLGQINHARNLWDRAVTIMPRANQLWYKYTYMEELLGNIAGARQVFERWMEWHPDEQAWQSFINMELRYNEVENARRLYKRLVQSHVDVKHWIKFAKFECRQGEYGRARQVYEQAINFFGEDNMQEALFVAFAKFEETQKEYERARAIYKLALDKLAKEEAGELFAAYTQFEKKYGTRASVEDVILSKRRFQYEEEVKRNPYNYDAWFDYLRLCESEGVPARTRDVYERAIACVPPVQEKRAWRRYIYLWIYYAVFEELDAEDPAKAREVYRSCLNLIPHKVFTFAKIWLLAAQFEIRQHDITAARKLLGTALGKCPKDKLFKGYIALELQAREFDRCRTLYNKFLEFNPANCGTWVEYAELEAVLGDEPRARALFELAVTQPLLDMPEVLWKAYIDFELDLGEHERVRALYDRLLQKTQHYKVWVSYANFEASLTANSDHIDRARNVFETADKEARRGADKAGRLALLQAWAAFEQAHGDIVTQQTVKGLMPRRAKFRRELTAADGTPAGWEEYYDYVFPDEQSAAPNFKLLQRARAWKTAAASLDVPDVPDDEDEASGSDDGDGGAPGPDPRGDSDDGDAGGEAGPARPRKRGADSGGESEGEGSAGSGREEEGPRAAKQRRTGSDEEQED